KEIISELKELCKELTESLPADTKAASLSRAWQEVLNSYAVYLNKAQQIDKIFSFNDIEEKAYKLLRENQSILTKYRMRYRYLMVDEFQDTNLLQKRLVYLLAGGNSEVLQDNRLFIVGDVKQSIYRFRGAEVGVFADVIRDIKASGGVNIELADNFRSSPQILNLCNNVFAQLMSSDSKEGIAFQELTPNREDSDLPIVLEVQTTQEQKAEAEMLEARLVVQKILEMTSKGYRFGDIAILLSVIGKANNFVTALREAHVPFRLVDGKGYFERQEVLDLINLLKFLDNSYCDLELCGVLRSPYFGISDNIITSFLFLRQEENLWKLLVNYSLKQTQLVLPVEEESKLKRAIAILQRLRSLASTVSLAELMGDIFDELSLEARLLGQIFGLDKVAHVKNLRRMALDLTMKQGLNLQGFLEKLQKMRSIETRIEVAKAFDGDDVVNIMTIHKSKGLEFPIVFLPSLNTRGRVDSDQVLFDDKEGLGIRVTGTNGLLYDSTIFKKIKEQSKELELAEKKRQLYVAMTRGERQIVLSGLTFIDKKTEAENSTWLGMLKKILGNSDAGANGLLEWLVVNIDDMPVNNITSLINKPLILDEDVYKKVKPLALYTKPQEYCFSATSLAKFSQCPRSYYYEYIAQLKGLGPAIEPVSGVLNKDEDDCKPLASNILGLIVHHVLENLETDGFNLALNKGLAKHAPEAGITARKWLKNLLENYLASDLYKSFSNYERQQEVAFNEKLFEVCGINILFTGSIDCLITYPDCTLGIIDYKSGKPPENREDANNYLGQIALYSLVAEKVFQRKVKLAELHFLENSTKVSLKIELEDFRKELLERCLAIIEKKTEQDFPVLLSACEFCAYNYLCPKS
ncbi:MAG TPA: UvrD-helicase domain-containing protein, partial [Candidatus Avacidaminococcus intestinavium]|nr:UvrD-helicase domain-containing protein [Candidatus Avacidaminococcus intestinavium]